MIRLGCFYQRSFRRIGFLAVAVLVVWSTALPGGFVWIDESEIEQGNYRVQSTKDLYAVWTQSLERYAERRDGLLEASGGYFRPIYAISISLDWLFWQRTTWLYHLENIFWHLIVVIGLYALGRRLFWGANEMQSESIAFWSALIFAVHPLGVHSANWISGRKDLLCAAFAIMALLCFSRVIEGVKRTTRLSSFLLPDWQSVGYLAASLVFLVLAIFSKEQAYVVPIIATVWTWSRWRDDRRPEDRNSMAWIAALFGLWATSGLAIFYRAFVLQGLGLGDGYHAETWFAYTGTFARLWWAYLARVFWPINPTIVDRWQLSQGWGGVEAFSILMLLVVASLALYAILRRSVLAACFLWYAIWMLPASGFLSLRHIYAERYLYPAMWGLIAIAVYAVVTALGRWPVGRRLLLIAISSALAIETFTENKFWWSDEALFQRAVSQDPQYVEGRIGLAAQALKCRDFKQTIEETTIALSAAQDTRFASYWSPFIAHTNVGLAYQAIGQYQNAKEHFQQALDSRPDNAIAYYHLGLNATAMQDLENAKAYYQKALLIHPDDYLSQSNLGHVFLRMNRPLDAVQVLRPLVAARPKDSINLSNMASALLLLGEFQEAELHFESLAASDPANPIYLAKLAWTEWKQGKLEEAKSHIQAAEKLAPSDPVVLGIAQRIL